MYDLYDFDCFNDVICLEKIVVVLSFKNIVTVVLLTIFFFSRNVPAVTVCQGEGLGHTVERDLALFEEFLLCTTCNLKLC